MEALLLPANNSRANEGKFPALLIKLLMPQRIIKDWDELRGLIGEEIGVSDWITIAQSRIDDFAEVTEDRQWIHIDTERARANLPEGKTIAHGFLTLSLLTLLMKQAVAIESPVKQAINYGLNRVRFPSPLCAGSEIRLRCVVSSLQDVPAAVQVCWNMTIEIKNVSKPALVAEWLVRYYH